MGIVRPRAAVGLQRWALHSRELHAVRINGDTTDSRGLSGGVPFAGENVRFALLSRDESASCNSYYISDVLVVCNSATQVVEAPITTKNA